MFNNIESSAIIPPTLYVDVEEVETYNPRKQDAVSLPSVCVKGLYQVEVPSQHITEPVEDVPSSAIDSLYSEDLNSFMLDQMTKTTSCFKKHSQRSEVCKSCPLLDLCLGIKTELKEEKLGKKKELEAIESQAKKLGFTLKGCRIPKEVSVEKNSAHHVCKWPIPCIVTKKQIELEETFVHVKGFGAMKAEVLPILKEYQAWKS